MKQEIVVTDEVRAILDSLRKLLAEQDYVEHEPGVAEKYARHETDMLFSEKDNAQRFLVVRATPTGLVSVLSFSSTAMYAKAKTAVDRVRKAYPKRIRWMGSRLSMKGGDDFWKRYFPEGSQEFAAQTIGANPE